MLQFVRVLGYKVNLEDRKFIAAAIFEIHVHMADWMRIILCSFLFDTTGILESELINNRLAIRKIVKIDMKIIDTSTPGTRVHKDRDTSIML